MRAGKHRGDLRCRYQQFGQSESQPQQIEISTYADFRKLIDDAGKLKLDAVVIATPDHIHAPRRLSCLASQLHVYCEKPLTHTVHEARTLAKLAEEKNRVTQMGTQIHAGDNYRRVVELLNAGAIGNVTKAHAWQGGSWSNGRYQAATKPDTLDWELWLGPRLSVPIPVDCIRFIGVASGILYRNAGRYGLPYHRSCVFGVWISSIQRLLSRLVLKIIRSCARLAKCYLGVPSAR